MIARRVDASFDDVSIFVAVATHRSFVEAGRRLGMPTSTISRAVARLEDGLGTRLLQRTSRRVALTDEGSALLGRAAAHVEGLAGALSATAEGRREIRGRLRVTAPTFTGTTRIAVALAEFVVAHPDVTVELDVANVFRDLIDDGWDFGVRVGPMVDADFVARKLGAAAFGIYATKARAQATLERRKRLRREDLERGPCVVMRANSSWRFRERTGARVEITPGATFVLADPRGIAEVARHGVGFALLPVDFAATIPELVRVETELGDPEPVELYVVHPSSRLLPLRVRAAIDWLVRAWKTDAPFNPTSTDSSSANSPRSRISSRTFPPDTTAG